MRVGRNSKYKTAVVLGRVGRKYDKAHVKKVKDGYAVFYGESKLSRVFDRESEAQDWLHAQRWRSERVKNKAIKSWNSRVF